MATAKTPKKIPAAAKPAVPAAKPAAHAVKATASTVKTAPAPVKTAPEVKSVAKPAPARAAEAKPPQEAVVHSAEIAKPPVAKAAETVAEIVPPPAAPPAAAAETAAQVAETIAPAVKKAADTAAEAAVKPFKAVAVVKKAAEDTRDSAARSMTPLLDYSRDSAILMIATGNQLALGLHKLSLSLIDWSAESCDKGVAAGQAMLSAKTVEEVVDLSRSLARDGLDQFFKESAELSSLSTRLIEDTIVPLPARLAAAAEKLAAHAA